MKTLIAVLNYNGKEHLKDCFESLLKLEGHDIDLLLLDNFSLDDSVRYVQENFPQVLTRVLDRNYGFTGAYNRIMDLADKYDFYVFLNNDVVVDPKMIVSLYDAFENENVSIAGSKLYLHGKDKLLNSAGIGVSPIGTGVDLGLGRLDTGQQDIVSMSAVCGAAFMVRTKVFKELGGFDEDYFAYLEDVDLCWRARLRGYDIKFVPKSIVYHKYGATAGRRESFFRVKCMQKNMLRNIIKNMSLLMALKALSISTVYTLLRMIIYILQLRFDLLWALLLGLSIDWHKTFRKRKHIQSTRLVSDRELIDKSFYLSLSDSIKEYISLNKMKGVL